MIKIFLGIECKCYIFLKCKSKFKNVGMYVFVFELILFGEWFGLWVFCLDIWL